MVLPESLEIIGDQAFASNDMLESAVIPNAVEIGAYAFHRCRILYDVEFGSGVRRIGEGAFRETAIGAEMVRDTRIGIPRFSPGELILPDNITHIGKAAFADCEFLGHVRLPNGLEEIPEGLFETDPSFGRFDWGPKTIIVPASVTRIGDCAFGWAQRIYFLGDAPQEAGEDVLQFRRIIRYANTSGWENFTIHSTYILSCPDLWREAEIHAGGWHALDWFGAFVPFEFSNWFYLAAHGWLYGRAGTTEQMAIYFPLTRHWATTGEAIYPWFYVHDPEGSWMLLESGSP